MAIQSLLEQYRAAAEQQAGIDPVTRGVPLLCLVGLVDPHPGDLTRRTAQADVERNSKPHGRSAEDIGREPAKQRRDASESSRGGHNEAAVPVEVGLRGKNRRCEEAAGPDCRAGGRVQPSRVGAICRPRDQDLDHAVVAQAGGDRGREQGQRAEGRRDAKVDEVMRPEPPLNKRGLGVLPPVRLVQALAALDAEAAQRELPLLVRKPIDCLRPAPGRDAVSLVHVADRVRDGPTECAGEGRAGQDEGDSDAPLLGLVPESEVVDKAWEQTSLKDAQ
uniref:Uncharacterized protein n=1 Tax=Fungal sp. (strain NRRL 50135) TaxID=1547289 RepID=A0A089GT76_FUNXX|nr:hypothetical protein gNR591 [fungal sp. NRRL 50135]